MWKQNAAQVISIVISSAGVIPKSLSHSCCFIIGPALVIIHLILGLCTFMYFSVSDTVHAVCWCAGVPLQCLDQRQACAALIPLSCKQKHPTPSQYLRKCLLLNVFPATASLGWLVEGLVLQGCNRCVSCDVISVRGHVKDPAVGRTVVVTAAATTP